MTVFLLVSGIILLFAYLIFLTQRRDQTLLKTPPHPEKLPNVKYNQLLREFNLLKDQPMPPSKRARSARIAEQYVLKEKLDDIARQTENEQRVYNIACKELEIAWQEYYDLYQSLSAFERLFSFSNINELRNLRNLYLDVQKRVAKEKEKITARERVKIREDQVIQEREDEIERKSARARLSSQTIESAQESDLAEGSADFTPNGGPGVDNQGDFQLPNKPEINMSQQDGLEGPFEEIKLSNDSGDTISSTNESPKPAPNRKVSGLNLSESESPEIDPAGHFGQDEFIDKYPDFNNCSYIDESLSLEELELTVVRDAVFENAYFVSVLFEGIHQYQDCHFTNTDFSQSVWQPAESPHRMLNCQFYNSHFDGATFEYFAFYNCQFTETSFMNSQFKLVKFVNCQFDNCIIDGVDFSNTVMSLDMLEKIDFTPCLHPPKNWTNAQEQTGTKSDEVIEASEPGPEDEEESRD